MNGRFLRFSPLQRKSRKTWLLRGHPQRSGTGTGLHAFLVDRASGPAAKGLSMHIDIITLQPLVALIFGILILILPRLLNYLIAIYLILVGLTGLFPHLFTTTV
jgi:hypothetical protein